MLKEELSFHSYLILSSTISTHCLQIVYNVLLLSSLSCYLVSLSLDYFYSFLIYYSILNLTVMFHFNLLLNHLPFFYAYHLYGIFFWSICSLPSCQNDVPLPVPRTYSINMNFGADCCLNFLLVVHLLWVFLFFNCSLHFFNSFK